MRSDITLAPAAAALPLVVGVSARALFDLEESDRLYRHNGLDAYKQHHRERLEEELPPGAAFPLIKALSSLNEDGKPPLVDVVVISSIDPMTGVRVMHSAQKNALRIERAIFTSGGDVAPYVPALNLDLLLSRSARDVQRAIDGGIAAATLEELPQGYHPLKLPIRIAFDGDSVLFDEAAEVMFRTHGLMAFREHEIRNAKIPMGPGPFAKMLAKIARIQRETENKAFRTAMITARGAPAHERAIRTLDAWGLSVNEALFMAGASKTPLLEAFGAHIFFDDSEANIRAAKGAVPSGRVPWPSRVVTAE